ncbi:MAG TPA: N-formylglutamate amidohydrolase, partial [Candidatus Paceibacterota bacterium]|nr:N-formylglutamate amidohydrolase [Candidatus Paceibacterota bacterium]
MSDEDVAPIELELATPFEVARPQEIAVPLIFNSPHSGRVYPSAFLAASRLDALSL